MKFINKLFGTKNEREIKKLQPRVQAVNALESKIEKLDDAQLRSRLNELKVQVGNQLADNKKNHDELACATSTCSSSAASCCTKGKIAEMRPVRARPWSPPCPATSTP
jgi:preprotein translocase subunit SecA